ncbi:MAG: hypothetical protein WEA99_12680 [Brumimicrobium sp.]
MNQKTNTLLLITAIILFSFTIIGQQEFRSLMNQKELPACFRQLSQNNVDELMDYFKTSSGGFIISSDYDDTNDVYTLSAKGSCHDTKALRMKHLKKNDVDYIFVFRELIEEDESYGNIQLYEKKDSLWSEGKQIEISWQHLFDVDKKKLQELKELDKHPKCMITFKKEGMRIEIPWEFYTYGEGSENNGYVKGGGKQPILLHYDYFLK